MENIKTIESAVRGVLEVNLAARDSDNVLYFCLIDEVAFERGFRRGFTAFDVFIRGKELGLPNYETVRRTRQKLQEKNPELRGSERATERREDRERVFHGYACNG